MSEPLNLKEIARRARGHQFYNACEDCEALLRALREARTALMPFAAWATDCKIAASDSPEQDKTVNELYPVLSGDLRRVLTALHGVRDE